jgi:hypothetical protein
MTKFYNKLSKTFFFILFFFLLTPSKQLFAETIIGAKLEKFIIENTISYVEQNGYYIKIKFDDNPKLYTFEVYRSQRSEQKVATHRDSWNFVNSKTAVYLGESKAPNDDLILSNVTFQIDDKFINFTKESIKWQAQYSFVNREIEWQKQAEIRRQEEIKKEQDRIKAEQLKKEAEAKAAIVKKQAEERAATAKKEAEERYARLEKEAQEKDRREAIINGIKLVALFTFIASVFFYLYKFQKDKIMQLYSKLKTKKKSSLQKNLVKQKSPRNSNEDNFDFKAAFEKAKLDNAEKGLDWKTTEGKITYSVAAIISIGIIYYLFFGYSGGTKGRLIIERPYGQGAFGPTNIECVYEMWDNKGKVTQYLPYGSIGGCPKYLE